MTVHDFRARQLPGGPAAKIVNGKPRPCGRLDASGELVLRDPSTIDGITLHQTAVQLPPGRRDLADAMGDRELARHLRALRVHAHITAFTTGGAVIAYPLRTYLHHANGLNASTIGLECEGSYAGLGKLVPQPVIDAGREALAWLVDNAPLEGITLRYIYAHRQSSATRRADPGLAIWRDVAVEYAIKELGLVSQPGYTWGNGRKIPKEWDPDGVGRY